MLPSCCHCRSCAHFLSVRHCRLKACWSIMLTNIMNYCTSKCCRHVLFNILESIRALSTPYPQPSANPNNPVPPHQAQPTLKHHQGTSTTSFHLPALQFTWPPWPSRWPPGGTTRHHWASNRLQGVPHAWPSGLDRKLSTVAICSLWSI